MYQIDIEVFFAIIVAIVFAFFAFLVLVYQRREGVLSDRRRVNTVFCCAKCGKIYTRPHKREQSVCPYCGTQNPRLKF